MNVLFYIEPLIERGLPYFKGYPWAEPWSVDMASALAATGGISFDYRVVINEPVSDRLIQIPAEHRIVVSTREMLDPFPGVSPLDILIGWRHQTHELRISLRYADLFRGRLGSFEPDVIISWTPAPFLKVAFPQALLLYTEYSVFSRRPFTETWFFDPIGVHQPAFLHEHLQGALSGQLFGSNEKLLVTEFKRLATVTLRLESPFEDRLRSFRARYGRVFLLALPVFGHHMTEGLCGYRSPFEMVLDCVERLPRDVGLVVTGHPHEAPMPVESTNWLSVRYPNLLLPHHFQGHPSPSDAVAHWVDGVIHVASKAAFSTLLFDKPLVTLGRGYLDFLSDATSLEGAVDALDASLPDRDPLLFWLMTRYAVPRSWLLKPGWLWSFFERCRQRANEGQVMGDFYDLIDDPVVIFGFYQNTLLERLTTHLTQTEVAPLKTVNDALRDEVVSLRETLSETVNESNALRTTVSERNNDVDGVTEALDRCRGELAGEACRRSSAEARTAELESEAGSLRAQVVQLTETLAAEEESLKHSGNELAEEACRRSSAEARTTELESEAASLRARVVQLTETLAAEEESLKHCRNELAEEARRRSSAEARTTELESEAASLRARVVQLTETLTAEEESLKHCRNELAEEARRRSSAEARNVELELRAASLQTQVTELRKELDACGEALLETGAELQAFKASLWGRAATAIRNWRVPRSDISTQK